MNMLTGKEKVVFPKTERNVMSLSKMYVNGTREEIKEDAGIAVNAMMASAINDPYVDLNPPSKF